MQRHLVFPLLAVVLSVVLAGCAHPAGSLQMEPVDDTTLAEHASYETSGADLYPRIDQERTARQIIENGSLTIPGPRPPVSTDLPYEYNGAYYNLSYDNVGEKPGASTLLHVDYNATDPEGTDVAFAELSAADREKLGQLLDNPPSYIRDGPDADVLLSYPEPSDEESVILQHAEETLIVTYEGSEYVISTDRVQDEVLDIYQYEATPVAESTEAYADDLRRDYQFTLSNLDEGETDVVETAIDDGYYAESTSDESFDSLAETFRQHRAIEGDEYWGSWLVQYDGQLYWAEMEFGAFVGDESDTHSPPEVTPN